MIQESANQIALLTVGFPALEQPALDRAFRGEL